jgi:hypothetical protein
VKKYRLRWEDEGRKLKNKIKIQKINETTTGEVKLKGTKKKLQKLLKILSQRRRALII